MQTVFEDEQFALLGHPDQHLFNSRPGNEAGAADTEVAVGGLSSADSVMFEMGPCGPLCASKDTEWLVNQLSNHVLKFTGDVMHARWWPYRLSGLTYVACDFDGVDGSYSVTAAVTGRLAFPPKDAARFPSLTLEFVDDVDAFFFIAAVLKRVGLAQEAEGLALGSRSHRVNCLSSSKSTS